MSSPRIHVHLNPDQARALFDRVSQGAHSPSQALAGLNALALLLGSHTEEVDRQGEAYRDIRAQLSTHLEQAREQLLGEQAAILHKGLVVIAPATVARVHDTLSREAFILAVERSCRNLAPRELDDLRNRVHHWCSEAEGRARDASPYPDAFNWQAAGIEAREYLAMQDLRAALDLM